MPASWAFRRRPGAHKRLGRPRLGLSPLRSFAGAFAPRLKGFLHHKRARPALKPSAHEVAFFLHLLLKHTRVVGASRAHQMGADFFSSTSLRTPRLLNDFHQADPTRSNRQLLQDLRTSTTPAFLSVDLGRQPTPFSTSSSNPCKTLHCPSAV